MMFNKFSNNWFNRLILKWTHHLWNVRIFNIVSRLYDKRVINSEQLHIILSKFDPTQDHEVY